MDACSHHRWDRVQRVAARVVWVLAVAAAVSGTAFAADEVPAPRAFEPGELSIGEPIALPFGRSAPGGAAASPPPADDPRAELRPPAAGVAVPGSGWLGLAVSESSVPGRWRVEEVAAHGPAGRAGIAVGDELRAVNGINMASAADVSQALTGIAAGQDVRVAVARADRVTDIVLRAEPRPPVGPAEPPRFVAAPAAQPASASPPSGVSAAVTASAPAAVAQSSGLQSSAPQWQAAAQAPQPAPDPRFVPGPAAAEPVATLPSVLAAPPPSASAAPAPRPPIPARGAGRTALGVRTVPIDAATQARFQLPRPAGAYVIGVVQDLPAAKAGVPPGSVIVALGEQPVRSPEELTQLVSSGPLDRPVTVQFVLPGGTAKQAAVVLRALDVPLERALTGDGPVSVPPPAFEPVPAPRRAERPMVDEATLRTEVRALRGMLDRLERLLDPAARRR